MSGFRRLRPQTSGPDAPVSNLFPKTDAPFSTSLFEPEGPTYYKERPEPIYYEIIKQYNQGANDFDLKKSIPK